MSSSSSSSLVNISGSIVMSLLLRRCAASFSLVDEARVVRLAGGDDGFSAWATAGLVPLRRGLRRGLFFSFAEADEAASSSAAALLLVASVVVLAAAAAAAATDDGDGLALGGRPRFFLGAGSPLGIFAGASALFGCC